MSRSQTEHGYPNRPNNAAWNKQSAWSPEVLARLITATNMAIESAFRAFNRALVEENVVLTEEQREEAYKLLVEGFTAHMAAFEKNLRARHVEVETVFQSK